MATKRYKLTTASKLLILLLIIIAIVGGIFVAVKKGDVKTKSSTKTATVTESKAGTSNAPKADADGNVINTDTSDDNTINVSLDEWTGWSELVLANGGLTTQPGSIYDKLGVKVNVSIINDATQSSNALISGSLQAAGYTINRTAFLSQKFKEAGMDVVMPYVTNFSNGADGIIATSDINGVADLVNAKIAVPQFSEAHSLVVWFVNQSDDITAEQKQQIINNLVYFSTPDEAAKAFFAGDCNVAATWEPYLTQATSMSDAHVLFSTKSSSSLVMDGILFNKQWAESHKDLVTKFIQGGLEAGPMYGNEGFDVLQQSMPMFSTLSEDEIKDTMAGAKLTTYADNINIFDTTGPEIYKSMCQVWESIGETVNEDLVNTLFDKSYIEPLQSEFADSTVTKSDANVTVTDDNKDEVLNAEALLQKRASVNFVRDTAKFADNAAATQTLNDFIATAKVLDGSIIEIAGNTDANPDFDPQDVYNTKLSEQRAETVKKFFVMNGIDANRIVTVGNGSSNPIAPNDTEENRAMNRRTDVSFKVIEG